MPSKWNWSECYNYEVERPIRKTLKIALEKWGEKQPGFAVDLGCGTGQETYHLLEMGWSVLAIDKTDEALELLKKRVKGRFTNKLKARKAMLENVSLPESDFILSCYALPFCDPQYFKRMWNEVLGSLNSKGIFAGNFFGKNDSWADRGITTLSIFEIEKMIAGYECLYMEENEHDGDTLQGEKKHWHNIDLVIRKY